MYLALTCIRCLFTIAFLSALIFSAFLLPNTAKVYGQGTCGDIIASPFDGLWYDTESPLETNPITDCSNPFGATEGVANPYTISIAEQSIGDGETVAVPNGVTNQFAIEGNTYLTDYYYALFKKEGDDYHYYDLQHGEISEADYREFAATYFDNQSIADFYVDLILTAEPPYYFYNDEGDPDLDLEGEIIDNRFWDFYDAVEDYYYNKINDIVAGEYSLVIHEYMVVPVYRSWWERFRDGFVNTAYADTPDRYTFVISFTITEELPEPAGPSSVLFLPGIMGSHLYEIGQQCNDFGEEQQRWFSANDCEQLRLLTRFDGVSINDIYTKANDNAVISNAATQKLYDSFMDEMNYLEGKEIIADFTPFAYDWRLRLDDLLKLKEANGKVIYDPSTTFTESYLYKTVEKMAEDSFSKKVTIVAHSNGGLLAKAFLERLTQTNDPLADKIDNLILVAVPQLGTPESLVSILHGSELGPNGLVVSQSTARRIVNTAPFSHHLLPNSSYFESDGVNVYSPVIKIADGEVTTPWKQQFGADIDSSEGMQAFLSKDSGRTKPNINDVLQPEVVDPFLLGYANTIDTVLNSWQPPADLKIYQIAGTGIETPTGISYYTGKKCASVTLPLFACGSYGPKLSYDVEMTTEGDGTVVVPSALAMSDDEGNVKRMWLDLFDYNILNPDRVHKNIFEVPDLTDFIKDVSSGESHTYEYLKDEKPPVVNEARMSYVLHSPLDMFVEIGTGVISSSTNTIDGATYRRYGDIQYISVPDSSADKKLVLDGEASGSFTLDVRKVVGDTIEDQFSYPTLANGTSTQVELEFSDFTSLQTDAVLKIDYQGDGVVDAQFDESGEKVTYDMVKDALTKLKIASIYKKLLLANLQLAYDYHKRSQTNSRFVKYESAALELLKQQVNLYMKKGLIGKSDGQALINLISKL